MSYDRASYSHQLLPKQPELIVDELIHAQGEVMGGPCDAVRDEALGTAKTS